MLHEFGHSVYSSKNIPQTVPYLLRMRGAHPHDRRHRDDVRAVSQAAAFLEKMGLQVADPKQFDEARPRCSAINC